MFSGHNSEWSGSMTMQLQPETLRHLDKLERLNLADNSIWACRRALSATRPT